MKSWRLRLTFGIAIAILTLNASADTPWYPTTETKTDSRIVIDPPIDVQTTKEIGESLVKTGLKSLKKYTLWMVKLKTEANGKFGFFAGNRQVKALAGATGILLHHSDDKNPMVCIDQYGKGVLVTNPKYISGCYVDTDKDGKFDSMAFLGHDTDGTLEQPVEYEITKKDEEIEEEFRDSYFVEVIYQGISKGEAKISYREFKGGIARPAFTQDITYELDPDGSGVIAFRGLRIKIVKATRESITYFVQKIGKADV
ncbi:hypothetical protein [Hydrogenophaga taeniospiralis]|uniref:hypothetical protein n=1 Tax=Hydrogenophaga taeniospiralis TaxID=65656 RepID=UPI001CFA201E|nr:hypothetical protein [Hydrogenophaga taeniospiralis]UCU95210.1 hypothetical protein KI616_04930 [Hydrogenophaga taeniospiralis]